MMETITKTDLDRALQAHKSALVALWDCLGLPGIEDAAITVAEGSKAYGRAYRLHSLKTGSGGLYDPPLGGDYLGMTKREAYDALVSRTSFIWEVVALKDRADRS
jgi:hypothetical protein